MQTLNEKERKLLVYIRRAVEESGYSPTVRDIQAALGYKSPSTVQGYLDRLVEAGYLSREEGKKRSVRPSARMGSGIPLIGTVRAGLPTLAEEAFEGYLSSSVVPAGYRAEELFALRVRGDSMKEAGILDGDTVVVVRRDYAENGETVVALVGDEATVKEFYRENGRYRLQPRNAEMAPIVVNEVQILGKVISVLRYYA